jgi:hypothetical protein
VAVVCVCGPTRAWCWEESSGDRERRSAVRRSNWIRDRRLELVSESVAKLEGQGIAIASKLPQGKDQMSVGVRRDGEESFFHENYKW